MAGAVTTSRVSRVRCTAIASTTRNRNASKGESPKGQPSATKTETEYLLKQAKAALSDEEYGADTWVKHQTTTLERVNLLLSILENPKSSLVSRIRLDISNAALITADNGKPIRVLRAARTRHCYEEESRT